MLPLVHPAFARPASSPMQGSEIGISLSLSNYIYIYIYIHIFCPKGGHEYDVQRVSIRLYWIGTTDNVWRRSKHNAWLNQPEPCTEMWDVSWGWYLLQMQAAYVTRAATLLHHVWTRAPGIQWQSWGSVCGYNALGTILQWTRQHMNTGGEVNTRSSAVTNALTPWLTLNSASASSFKPWQALPCYAMLCCAMLYCTILYCTIR